MTDKTLTDEQLRAETRRIADKWGPDHFEDAIRDALAAGYAAAVAGIPREPTGEMVSAGCRADGWQATNDTLKTVAAIWRAMYDAAPREPAKAEPVAWMRCPTCGAGATCFNCRDSILCEVCGFPQAFCACGPNQWTEVAFQKVIDRAETAEARVQELALERQVIHECHIDACLKKEKAEARIAELAQALNKAQDRVGELLRAEERISELHADAMRMCVKAEAENAALRADAEKMREVIALMSAIPNMTDEQLAELVANGRAAIDAAIAAWKP